jgi:hypothetical protein
MPEALRRRESSEVDAAMAAPYQLKYRPEAARISGAYRRSAALACGRFAILDWVFIGFSLAPWDPNR